MMRWANSPRRLRPSLPGRPAQDGDDHAGVRGVRQRHGQRGPLPQAEVYASHAVGRLRRVPCPTASIRRRRTSPPIKPGLVVRLGATTSCRHSFPRPSSSSASVAISTPRHSVLPQRRPQAATVTCEGVANRCRCFVRAAPSPKGPEPVPSAALRCRGARLLVRHIAAPLPRCPPSYFWTGAGKRSDDIITGVSACLSSACLSAAISERSTET